MNRFITLIDAVKNKYAALKYPLVNIENVQYLFPFSSTLAVTSDRNLHVLSIDIKI